MLSRKHDACIALVVVEASYSSRSSRLGDFPWCRRANECTAWSVLHWYVARPRIRRHRTDPDASMGTVVLATSWISLDSPVPARASFITARILHDDSLH
jgi:hypothetical protein